MKPYFLRGGAKMDALKIVSDAVPENRVNLQAAKFSSAPRNEVSAPVSNGGGGEKLKSVGDEAYCADIKLNYSVHESTGQVVVKVINGETGKVIREIPPKEILALTESMKELEGLLFDQNM
jgi:flagellar protein FlaG